MSPKKGSFQKSNESSFQALIFRGHSFVFSGVTYIGIDCWANWRGKNRRSLGGSHSFRRKKRRRKREFSTLKMCCGWEYVCTTKSLKPTTTEWGENAKKIGSHYIYDQNKNHWLQYPANIMQYHNGVSKMYWPDGKVRHYFSADFTIMRSWGLSRHLRGLRCCFFTPGHVFSTGAKVCRAMKLMRGRS